MKGVMKPRSLHRTPRTQAKMNRVLGYLRTFTRGIFLKLETMAKRFGWSVSTIRRLLAELKRDGKISWTRRGPTSCLYSLEVAARLEHSLEQSLEHSTAPDPLSECREERGVRKPPTSTATRTSPDWAARKIELLECAHPKTLRELTHYRSRFDDEQLVGLLEAAERRHGRAA